MTNPADNPNQYMIDEAMGYVYAAALRAATVLGVAEHLADGPRTVAELAELTGSHGQSLRRVLRLLATRDIFSEDDDGRFHLTPRAEVLRPDVPGTVHPGVLAITADIFWLSVADLADAVRHGEPAFDRRFGRPFFDYLQEHPDVGATFNAGMANFTEGEIDRVVSGYDFPDDGVLVDVGGGLGGLLLAILRARPGLRGVLLDREQVVAGTVLGQLGADDRWAAVAGDFFEAVPPGDFYTLKNVLHDWSDDQCVRVLTNCRHAMRPGAKVLVVEVVLPSGNEPHFGKVLDVFIMQLAPGRERTLPEFEDIFTRAGFRIIRVIPTAGAFSLIEAAPET